MRRPPAILSTLPAVLAALAVAGPAQGAATSSGTLDLGEGAAAARTTAGYAWQDAPLLTGPAATAQLGLPAGTVRMSDSRYLPVTLRSLVRPQGPFDAPGCPTSWRVPGSQSAEVVDRRALLESDGIALNVLRGRGTADVRLASVGGDAYRFGEYVATGVLRVTTDGCAEADTGEPVAGDDAGPFHAVEDLAAFRIGGDDRVLGRFAPEMLERRPVRLRRSGGAWHGMLTLDDPATAGYPATSARLEIALSGTPVELHAMCTLPAAMSWPGTSVRSRRAAGRLLRRAGFSQPVFAGRRRLARSMRGDYVVTDYSSSRLPCDLRLKYRLGRG